MESVIVPIPTDCKVIRDRVIRKVKLALSEADPKKWEEIYEDLSEAEYFVFYGNYLRAMIGCSIVGEEDRWIEYKDKMLKLEKKCDELLN